MASDRVVTLIAGRDIEVLDDRELMAVMAEITAARNALDVLAACAARVIDARSARELGRAGLAQRHGHRNATELLQTLTGQSRREVTRSVKTGGDLLPSLPPSLGPDGGRSAAASGVVPEGAAGEWLDHMSRALRDGTLGHAQFQAIRVGLGEPPVERYPELDPDVLPRAWATAAERLIDEAPHLPVEELRAFARIARDRLDPVGVTLRFEERFAARSYRSWIDEHGQRHGRFVFDDDAAAWVDGILHAALRPRRGPRFVDPDALVADASDDRSGEQIAYDTLIAVMRTGAAADPAQAFGDRQPGVRIVVEASAPGAVGGRRVGGDPGGGASRPPCAASGTSKTVEKPFPAEWSRATCATRVRCRWPSMARAVLWTSVDISVCSPAPSGSRSRCAMEGASGSDAVPRSRSARCTTSTTGRRIAAGPTSTTASHFAGITTSACTIVARRSCASAIPSPGGTPTGCTLHLIRARVRCGRRLSCGRDLRVASTRREAGTGRRAVRRWVSERLGGSEAATQALALVAMPAALSVLAAPRLDRGPTNAAHGSGQSSTATISALKPAEFSTHPA
ncbi:conserved protein [Microbacterium testaceum StLB037]|uniref:Conserved protein n=1 Tax=Microbacterium testaceum (strain StLB037) TaxID=979556 RepID=E8NFL6_MICTS|nr:conserved protein [Microbacterium testaceum StLB037]